MTAGIVTIDVEPDNVWADTRSTGMENISALKRFHDLCTEFGIRPTYLVTYSVACNAAASAVVESLLATGSCEVGAHPHFWETPPVHPLDQLGATVGNRYEDSAVEDKLGVLTTTLRQRFGSIVSHRAGRWGFDDRHAAVLARHGYAVDSSVTPGLDWTVTGAPDYSAAPLAPYSMVLATGQLVEVPCTIRPGRWPWKMMGGQARRVMRRLGMGPAWLRCAPGVSPALLLSVSEWARSSDLPLVLMTHSSELATGQSPMWRTDQDVAFHFDCYRKLFAAWNSMSVVPETLSEYAAESAQ